VTRVAAVAIALVSVAVVSCSTAAEQAAVGPAPEQQVPSGVPATEPGTGSPSAEPAQAQEDPGPPRFVGGVYRIGPELRETLIGRNWTPGCPVPISDLRLVQVSYWNFHGKVRQGPLVLNEKVADDVLWVFKRLFRAKFPIRRIVLASKDRPITNADYWDKSPRSSTASFNCRPATGSTVLSEHSYGWAIDINPLQNPYVRNDGTTLRYIARPFRDRSLHRKGMIHEGDIVVRSFAAIGWEWGGHWHTLKDYMHFSLTGR
jgi:D-alanyl-D-alanine carboxypeptidase-like protein